MVKIYFALLVFILLLQSVSGQVSAYTFSSTNGTYTPITGGTLLKYGDPVSSANTSLVTLSDNYFYNRPIGFNFMYNGVSFNSFGISSHGWIILGGNIFNGGNESPYPLQSNNAALKNIILGGGSYSGLLGGVIRSGWSYSNGNVLHGFQDWQPGFSIGDSVTDDITNFARKSIVGGKAKIIGIGLGTSGSPLYSEIVIDKTVLDQTNAAWDVRNGEIRYETSGVVGSRSLVVEFTRFSRLINTSYDKLNFQIKLNEGTNVIEVIYDKWITLYGDTTNYRGISVGLKGTNNTDFNNRTNSSGVWSATSAGTTNTETIRFFMTGIDPRFYVYHGPSAGLTYKWTPPACSAPTEFIATPTTVTSETISWNAISSVTQYDYEIRTTGVGGSGATGLVSSGTAATNTVSFNNLTEGTDYKFYVRSNCGGAGKSAWFLYNFKTASRPVNDSCGASTTLKRNIAANATTAFANNSIAPVTCQANLPSSPTGDVWFNFLTMNVVTGSSATITVNNVAGTFDPVIALYSGTPGPGCTGLVYMTCANAAGAGGSEILNVTNLVPGVKYYVRVYGTDAANANSFSIIVSGPALPVTFSDFHGEKQGLNNKLMWSTQTEINNKGFDVERSIDGITFYKLTTIYSASVSGNSTSVLNYNYSDKNVAATTNYYRIKQIDRDGNFEYSKTILIKSAKAKAITFRSIYPNPATENITVEIESPVSDKLSLRITDATGKVVSIVSKSIVEGGNLVNVDISSLSSGNYFIQGSSAGKQSTGVLKFFKK